MKRNRTQAGFEGQGGAEYRCDGVGSKLTASGLMKLICWRGQRNGARPHSALRWS